VGTGGLLPVNPSLPLRDFLIKLSLTHTHSLSVLTC